jgi:hypothetical protein
MPSHLLEHQPDRNAYQALGQRPTAGSNPAFTLRALHASGGTAVKIAAENDPVSNASSTQPRATAF